MQVSQAQALDLPPLLAEAANQPLQASDEAGSLSTSPSSILTVRQTTAEPHRVNPFLSQSVSPYRVNRNPPPLSDSRARPPIPRRRTVASLLPPLPDHRAARASNSRGDPGRVPSGSPRDEEQPWVDLDLNLSSASSFEDLGFDLLESSEADGDGVPSRQQSVLPLRRRPRASAKKSGSRQSRRGSRADLGPAGSTTRLVASGLMQRPHSSLRADEQQHSVQSEPEGGVHTGATRADDAFLELLEAARTFISMRPSEMPAELQGAATADDTISNSVPLTGASVGLPALSPHQDQEVPPSMSSSTNFALYSSDSPPSQGLLSSQELSPDAPSPDLSSPRDESHPTVQLADSKRAQGASMQRDDTLTLQRPTPTSAQARSLQESMASTELAASSSRGHKDDHHEGGVGGSPESWWDWIGRHIRAISIGAGMLGFGLVVAIGVGVLKKPTLRRR